jgi:hypothetical protein
MFRYFWNEAHHVSQLKREPVAEVVRLRRSGVERDLQKSITRGFLKTHVFSYRLDERKVQNSRVGLPFAQSRLN